MTDAAKNSRMRGSVELRRLYDTLVETLPDAVTITDLEGNILEVSSRTVEIHGFKNPRELIGKNAFQFIAPKDWKRAREGLEETVREGFIRNREYVMLRKDGSSFIGELNAALVRDEFGNPKAFVGITRDVTYRKVADEVLRESEEKYRDVVERANDGILIIQDEVVKYANPRLAEMAGCGVEDIVGKKFTVFLHPSVIKDVVGRYRRRMAGEKVEQVYETLLERKNGDVVNAEINAGFITYNGKPADLVIVRDITERKRVENELKESEARYRNLIENSIEGIGISRGNIVVFANKALLEIFGYESIEEFTKVPLLDHVAPEFRSMIRSRMRSRSNGESLAPRFEYRILRKNGEIRDVEISTSEILMRGERFVQSTFRDITERKRVEEALKESEEHYRGLVESQSDLIVRVDAAGRFTFVNDAYCRKFGKQRGELLGKTFMPLVHKDDLPRTLKAMEGLKVPPYRIQVDQRARTAKGWRWIFWEDYAIRDEGGRIVEIQAVGRDITERKEAEVELEGLKNHLQTVLDGIDEAIVVIDRDYRIVSHNKAFVKSLRRRRKRIVGELCFKVIHGFLKPCRACVVRDMFRTGKPSFDVHYHLERGNKIFHEVKAYPIKDALGKVSHSIYVFRDVTERETMYERVREAKMRLEELNSMKSYFISIASHELKTPLAIVKGYVDVMQDGVLGRVNRKQKEKLEAISLNIRHLSNLVENILDLSRIEAGELKLNRRKTDVNRLVSGILRDFRPLAEERGITLSFRKAVLGRVMMDPDRMKQVIINLLDNSLKFTPHGGRITVSTRRMQNQLALTVRDTGVGIPKKSLGRIFDRFYQVDSTSHRKYKGFGLGLSICKSIVELHGGSISIKSRVNRGTSVSITLPV